MRTFEYVLSSIQTVENHLRAILGWGGVGRQDGLVEGG
jgi:hypothetical protein